jgi:hypothetical protein
MGGDIEIIVKKAGMSLHFAVRGDIVGPVFAALGRTDAQIR